MAAHTLLCILLLNKDLLDFLGKIYGLKGIFVKEIIEISFIKVSWHSLLSYNTQFCVYKILDRSSNCAEKMSFLFKCDMRNESFWLHYKENNKELMKTSES